MFVADMQTLFTFLGYTKGIDAMEDFYDDFER
jgi:hypothetical protein